MLSRDSLLHFLLFLMLDYNQIIVSIMNANFEYCEYYVIVPSTAICANEYQNLGHCLCKMDLYIRTVILAMLAAHARTKYSICFINNKLYIYTQRVIIIVHTSYSYSITISTRVIIIILLLLIVYVILILIVIANFIILTQNLNN